MTRDPLAEQEADAIVRAGAAMKVAAAMSEHPEQAEAVREAARQLRRNPSNRTTAALVLKLLDLADAADADRLTDAD